MVKYIFTYMATGGINIEAEDEEGAQRLFDKITDKELLDQLEPNSIEGTGYFEEDEDENACSIPEV